MAATNIGVRRIEVHQHLVEQAHAFMSDPWRQLEFREPATPAILLRVLHKEGLVAFNRATRGAISELAAGVDSRPYWDLVDATGFWEDSTPGKWAHMTQGGIESALQWAARYRAGSPFLVAQVA